MKRLLSILTAFFLLMNIIDAASVSANSGGSVIQVDAGSAHNIALKSDGTVVAWGNEGWDGPTSAPEGLQGVKSVSAGSKFSIVLKNDGTVTGWGEQNFMAWLPPEGLNNILAIAAGGRHSLALKNDGTVVGWGDNNDGQASPPDGLKNVVKVAAGQQHSLALKSDGTVVAWGDNDYGQTNVPASLTNVKAVAGGDQFSLALKNDGTVVMWGANTNAQELQPPKGLSGVTAIAAGGFHALALKNDGTVIQWGSYTADPPPANLKNVTAISAGRYHSIALLNDGTLVTWEHEQSSIPVSLRHKSTNANLNSIIIDKPIAELNPIFSKVQTQYNMDVSINTDLMLLHASAEDRYAIVKRYYGNGLPAPMLDIPLGNGPTIVNFIVTAEDGITTKKYTVKANQVLDYGQVTAQQAGIKTIINLSSANLIETIRQSKEIDIFRVNLQKENLAPAVDIVLPADLVYELKQKSNLAKVQINTATGTVELPILRLKDSEQATIQLRKKQLPTIGSFFYPGIQKFGNKYYILKPYTAKKIHKTFQK